MTFSCNCSNEVDKIIYELPMQDIQQEPRSVNACPACGRKGKPVQMQTVKAMLSVSLREVRDASYLFCKTRACAVVYFSLDGEQTFTTEEVREKVYQKLPDLEEVFVCYCFQHPVGEIRTGSSKARTEIVDDINQGIRAGQCACDLRNPQGSCCLGNVNALIKQIEKSELQVIPRS